MNLVLDMERPIILPRSTILERWEHLRTSPQRSVFFGEKVKAVTFRCANIFPICLSMFLVAAFNVYP